MTEREFSCSPVVEFGGTMGYCKFAGLTPLTLYKIRMVVTYPRGELDAEILGTTAPDSPVTILELAESYRVKIDWGNNWPEKARDLL